MAKGSLSSSGPRSAPSRRHRAARRRALHSRKEEHISTASRVWRSSFVIAFLPFHRRLPRSLPRTQAAAAAAARGGGGAVRTVAAWGDPGRARRDSPGGCGWRAGRAEVGLAAAVTAAARARQDNAGYKVLPPIPRNDRSNIRAKACSEIQRKTRLGSLKS